MTRSFLFLYALLFLGFGLFVLANPQPLIDAMGAASMTSDGTYELRSNYGGVSVGIGLLCLVAVFRDVLQRPALFVLMTYSGGYALGRLAALPMDGVPSGSLIAYAVFETLTALLAFGLLSRLQAAR